jgi:hypothetical protein
MTQPKPSPAALAAKRKPKFHVFRLKKITMFQKTYCLRHLTGAFASKLILMKVQKVQSSVAHNCITQYML